MRPSKKFFLSVVAFLEGKSPAEQKWHLPEADNQGRQVELREPRWDGCGFGVLSQ